MIGCMITTCHSTFPRIEEYLCHLKNDHSVPVEYRYKCTVGTCQQLFSKFYPFKKHIRLHRSVETVTNVNDSLENPVSAEIFKESPLSDDKSNYPKIRKLEKNVSPPDPKLGEDDPINEATINLTLLMHMKNNMTRKDVYILQQAIGSMLQIFANEIENLDISITDPEKKFCFKKLMSKMRDNFRNINSDHKFFKYLQNINVFELPKIVIVEGEEVVERQLGFEGIEENEISKNYLIIMPIVFQIRAFFESDNVLERTIHNTRRLAQSNTIINFVNGSGRSGRKS